MTFAGRWGALGPWILAAMLAVTAVGASGIGLWRAWGSFGDGDMQKRVTEYDAFRVGDYPNTKVDRPQAGRTAPYTVYPPYALPMFAVFFEPGGLLQGRILVEVLTFAAIVLMGFYGHGRLKPFGPAWAAVGAVAGAAIAGNGSAIALGQFSVPCAGLLVGQLLLLPAGRGTAAGLCWAGAMIKPQIGAAFCVLFLVNRQVRGLMVGAAVLAALSAVALWWTETSLVALAEHWLFRMQMKFAVESSGIGPGHVAEWLGWDHRVTQLVALAALASLGLAAAAVARLVQRDIAVPDLLPLAGMCSVLGRVLTYHRHYDNVMLFPLLIAWLSLAVATPTVANVATAAAVGLTLWIPQRVQDCVPFLAFVQPAIWIIAGLRLATLTVNVSPAPAKEGAFDG